MGWHSHVMRLVADVNPRRVGMHDIQIQPPVLLLTHAFLPAFPVRLLIPLIDLAAFGPVAIGL
jgi:hypothetical protein